MGRVFYRVPNKADVDYVKLAETGITYEDGKCGVCGETIIYHAPAMELVAAAAPDMTVVCNRCEDFVRASNEEGVAHD